MGPQLHETPYGKSFFGHQLPALINAINRLADALEAQNKAPQKKTPKGADKK